MLGKKGKIFVLVGMVALLVVTGVLNIVLNKNATSSSVNAQEATSASFFETYRLDRTETRAETVMYLDAIISDEASSADAVTAAENDKLALTSAMELELVLEGLIKAAGFEDAVVTATSENINVILKTPELTEDQATKVLEIITAETDRKATSIRIIPVE
jgi:stage III sporulation protein AH